MAQKSIYELSLNISANSAELKKGLDEANRKIDGFGKNAQSIGKMVSTALNFAGVGLSIAGVFKTLKTSMEAVEGPGDRLEAVISGGKEALFEMQRAIGQMDFSNLLKNLEEGFKRGKEFAEAMDELADRQAFADYKVVALEAEAEILRGIFRNKGLELEVRQDAANKIMKIEEQILERKKDILAETYLIEKTQWEGRNDMTIEKGVELYEKMSAVTKKGLGTVSGDTVEKLKEMYQSYVKAEQIIGGSIEKIAEGGELLLNANLLGTGNYDWIKEIPTEELKELTRLFKEFTIISESGEADVWPKLFALINKNALAVNAAQRDYNAAVKQTSTVTSQEVKEDEKKLTVIEEMTKALAELSDEEKRRLERNALYSPKVTPVSTANLSLPTFANSKKANELAPMKMAEPLDWRNMMPAAGSAEEVLNEYRNFTAELNNILAQGLATVAQTMAEGLGALIIEGKSALPKLAMSVMDALANVLSQLSAVAFGVAFGITAIKKALQTLNPVVALAAGVALAVLAGVVKAGVAKIASNQNKSTTGASAPSVGNFADGGVVYGETIARVAEYSGARTNPEIIAPLDKLKSLLGGSGGGIVEFQIKDDILYGILDRRNRKVNSYA